MTRTLKAAGSLAQFTQCCNRFPHHFDIGIIRERTELVCRSRVTDVSNHSRHSSPHLRVAALEVAIELAHLAFVFTKLIQVYLDLVILPAIESVGQFID